MAPLGERRGEERYADTREGRRVVAELPRRDHGQELGGVAALGHCIARKSSAPTEGGLREMLAAVIVSRARVRRRPRVAGERCLARSLRQLSGPLRLQRQALAAEEVEIV